MNDENQRIYFIRAPVAGGLVDVGFDCVPVESITSEAVVTSSPVEFGAEVSDHFYVKPLVLNLQVIVSNTPLRAVKDDIVSVSGFGDSGALTRSSAAWQVLRQIQMAGVPFSVQTGFERVSNMVISMLGAERRSETSGALICDVTLTQVIIATTRTEALPKESLANNAETSATPKPTGKAQPDEKKTEAVKAQPSFTEKAIKVLRNGIIIAGSRLFV